MKFTVEIDDSELEESIKSVIVKNAVEEVESRMFGDSRYERMRKIFKDNVHAEMLKMIREHEAEVTEKAVTEAASILARKAFPKMMETMMEGAQDG